MASLADMIRRNRRSKIKVGDFEFSIRRPTDLQAVSLGVMEWADGIRALTQFVEDWHGVKASDIVPGQPEEEIPFDADLLAEWLEDEPDLWGDLAQGIRQAHAEHSNAKEEQGKH